MSSTVIKVEGLGKEYVIGGCDRSDETLREMLASSLSAPIRRLGRAASQAYSKLVPASSWAGKTST
jgi:hypothetical protein